MRVGQYLYASCSARCFGPILRMGKDANNHDVIDLQIDVEGLNDFLEYDRFDTDTYESNSIAYVAGNSPLVFVDLQYRNLHIFEGTEFVNCNTPGNGCNRCTYSFQVVDEKLDWCVDHPDRFIYKPELDVTID